MKRIKKIFASLLALSTLFTLGACRESDVIKHNIQRDADYFNVYRRCTFINLRTDRILYIAEGYFSIYEDETNGMNEITLVFQIGAKEYKIDYFSKHENVAYVIQQIENTHTDPYHWEFVIFVPIPDYGDY